MVDIKTSLCGITLDNPVIPASGLSLEDWKRASPKDIPNGLPDTQFLINQKY